MFLNEDTILDTNAETVPFLEGVSPLLEACLESEMTWGNIIQEGIQREYSILKNEEGDTAENMKKSDQTTIAKIKQWIKDRIASITAAFKKMARSIADYTAKVYAYAVKVKEDGYESECTAKIREWKNVSIKSIANQSVGSCTIIDNLCGDKKTVSAEDIKQELDSFKDTIKKDFIVSEEVTDRKVKSDVYINVLRSCKNDMKELTQKGYSAEIKNLKKFDKDVSKEQKASMISIYKSATSAISSITSLAQSTATKLIADSVKVMNAAKKKKSKEAIA